VSPKKYFSRDEGKKSISAVAMRQQTHNQSQ